MSIVKHLLLSVVAAVALTACGSTVQVAGSGVLADGGIGLGEPLSGTVQEQPSTRARGGLSGSPAVDSPGVPTDRTGSMAPGTGDPSKAVTSLPRGDRSPLEVGFLVAADIGEAAAALGYPGLSTGSGRRQAQVAAGLLNAHGGLAGHRVVPVVFEADSTAEAGQYQTACSTFFDDHKVRAVVGILVNEVVMACAKQHGVPFVAAGVNSIDDKGLAANPHVVIPNQTTNDRAAVELVDGLVRLGWFRPSSPTERVVIGLVTHDEPQYAKVPAIVAARLRAAGLTLTDTAYQPYPRGNSDIARASSAGKANALKFQSQGINRVVGIDSNGFALAWFAIGAGSQSYYPRLGMTTLSEPSIQPAVLTPQQLEGSAGIGWAPYLDTSVQYQQPITSRTTECLNAMRKAGENTSSATVRLGAMGVCEGAFTLADAWQGGQLDVTGFQQGLDALGSSYRPVSVFGTDFRRSRAAADRYRAIRYEARCDCYRYTGPMVRFR